MSNVSPPSSGCTCISGHHSASPLLGALPGLRFWQQRGALKGRAGLAMAQMMSHKSGLKPALHSSCKSHEAGCFSPRHGNLLFLLLHRKIKLHSRRWVQLRWLAKAPSLSHRLVLPAKGVFLLEERKASPPLAPSRRASLVYLHKRIGNINTV